MTISGQTKVQNNFNILWFNFLVIDGAGQEHRDLSHYKYGYHMIEPTIKYRR